MRVALASNMHAPGAILADLIEHGGWPSMCPCPHWPDAVAAMCEVRRLAAGNPATPVAAVERLIAEPEPVFALALTSRADLPDQTYVVLFYCATMTTSGEPEPVNADENGRIGQRDRASVHSV
ncbi:MAG TPA: hypothetical protein VF788_02900 [Pseudonocardiaceae bacterium]